MTKLYKLTAVSILHEQKREYFKLGPFKHGDLDNRGVPLSIQNLFNEITEKFELLTGEYSSSATTWELMCEIVDLIPSE